jgi:small-conductance mechanosensitive channel
MTILMRVSAVFFALFFATWADAQIMLPSSGNETPPPIVELTSTEAVREMVSRMSDAEVRAVLLERLDAVAAEAALQTGKDDSLLDLANRTTLGVLNSIAYSVGKAPLLIDNQIKSFANFGERLGMVGIVFLFIVLTAAIAVGVLIEQIFYRLIRRWTINVDVSDGPRSLRQTGVFLIKRLVAEIAGVIVFFFAASQIGPVIAFNLAPIILGDNAPQIMPMVGGYINGVWFGLIVLPRIGAAVVRFLLAPGRPEYRIIFTDDWTAKFLLRHQVGFLLLVGFTIWIIQFNDMNGVAMGESRLGFWLSIAIHCYFAWLSWRARAGLTIMMRGTDPQVTPIEEKAAQLYPYFIIGLVIVTWFMVQIIVTYEMWDLLVGAPSVKMILLLAYAPVMDTMVRGLVRHLIPPMTGEGLVAERAYQSTKRSYIRIGRIIVFGLVILAIGKIWGIDFANLATAGIGAQFAGRFFEIMMIVAIGYLVWEVVSLWINRKLAAEQTADGFDLSEDEPAGGEGGGAGGSRLSTVLPLLLGVSKACIAVIFGLIALGNIGIDITPLLAGAGIVGIALGFGAQKLVADVVSGIFFLIDDAFRTGEYVAVEGTVGTVEKISIRSMQLRHHKGPVHTIPYGEIPKITNFSRDWVIMKLKFTVPFNTDPNKVKKIFKQIGKDLQEVPELAADLLQPFKSQGVFDFDDVGMIIRGKFMAKPGKQFTLRKEIYNRVKTEFEANGIDFARREVRVAIPGLDKADDLTSGQKAAVAAAATQAAQSKELPPAK